MVTWGVTDADVSRIGDGGDAVIEADDWMGYASRTRPALADDDGPASTSLDPRVQAPVTGSTTRLTIPATTARLHGEGTTRLADHTFPISDGSYRLLCTLPSASTHTESVTVVTRFQGPASLDRTERQVQLSFDRPRTVTIRTVSETIVPPTVTVPPTPAGLASGLSAISAVPDCDGPERSHPATRPHPPLLALGDSVQLPDAIEQTDLASDVTLTVPDSLAALFVAAPLAYYLGAAVDVDDVDRPILRTETGTFERSFSPMPGFQYECASLLRQVFHLDCLVRADTPDDQPLVSARDLDPPTLRELPVADRLCRYSAVFGEQLRRQLPEWHLSTYASPTVEHVPALPYLLDDLSLVYLPAASKLESTDLLDRTLSDAYRSAAGDVSAVDVVDPELGPSAVHAWLAEGAPLDAFKMTPSAYRHRRRYADGLTDPFTVSVVLNDESMTAEHSAVAEIYRTRAAEAPIDVTVHSGLRTDELASIITEGQDFLHYIGHCETSGLRCPDGSLSLETLSESRTRTFFLNACGSYHEGLRLVEQGSLAGAVTLRAVLNEQAAKVGTAFARLLMHGFSIERALQLARRRILMGKDYAVVGDGTDALIPARGQPAVLRLSDDAAGYHVTYEAVSPTDNGRQYQCLFDGSARLCGQPTETTVSADELRSLLDRTSLPVIYNGAFHWSNDLVDTI